VDHQVENDVDIEAARREDAEAVDFEKQRDGQRFFERGDGWVEALQVSRLQDAAVFLSQPGETFGTLRRFGDRLFDQNIDAGFEQARRDGFVGDGRSRDDSGIDLPKYVIDALMGAFDVRVDDGNELDVGHLTDDTDMMTTEGAGAYNGNAKSVHSGG